MEHACNRVNTVVEICAEGGNRLWAEFVPSGEAVEVFGHLPAGHGDRSVFQQGVSAMGIGTNEAGWQIMPLCCVLALNNLVRRAAGPACPDLVASEQGRRSFAFEAMHGASEPDGGLDYVDAVSTSGVREETILFRVGVARSDATSMVAVTVRSTVASLIQAENEVEECRAIRTRDADCALLPEDHVLEAGQLVSLEKIEAI